MEFRQLEYFLGVASELHFSRAADKLFIAQPALSRQIQQLEENLGVLLFERDKRNVIRDTETSYKRAHDLRYVTQRPHIKELMFYYP